MICFDAVSEQDFEISYQAVIDEDLMCGETPGSVMSWYLYHFTIEII
jgi:hypothetical protein